MGQEARDLVGHDRGLTRDHELEIRGDRVEQPMLVDDVRQAHQQHHEQRHDRQQRVVGDRTRQEKPLAAPEAGHHAPTEVEERSLHSEQDSTTTSVRMTPIRLMSAPL